MINKLLYAGCLVCVTASASAAEPVALSDFFRAREFSDVRMSPDGEYIAAIVRVSDQPQARNIVTMHLDSGESRVITGYTDSDVRSLFWANDERLVFNVDKGFDTPGEPAQYRGSFVINRDGSDGKSIVVKKAYGMFAYLSRVPADPDHLLVVRPSNRWVFPEVHRLDVDRARHKLVVNNHGNVTHWVADNTGFVRAAIDQGEDLDDRREHLLYRSAEDEDWRELLAYDAEELQVLGFDRDNKTMIVASRVGRDRFVLTTIDGGSGRFGEVLVEDPVYDVWTAEHARLTQDKHGAVLSYRYLREKPTVVFFDEQWAARQAALDSALPGTVNDIVNHSYDGTRMLVYAYSDRVPGEYYLYDEQAGSLRFLVSTAEWIDPDRMAPMTPISFESRDGLDVHGYLTVPAGTGGKGLPLIVHPHGGPYGVRDAWEFNPDVQFLASRGYAVLQVNYRGSGGYGRDFLTRGYRRWGLEMQDDLTDAARWAIAQGIADPERVAIYGASYGGYATMMGLAKTPELYACGVNYVGVTDLNLLVRDWNNNAYIRRSGGLRELRAAWMREVIGTAADKDRLLATSPVQMVDKIRAPVLVIHGQRDAAVDIEHYRRLVAQLKKHDVPHDTMLKRHEGHGFLAQQNKEELYTRVEAFLAEHL